MRSRCIRARLTCRPARPDAEGFFDCGPRRALRARTSKRRAPPLPSTSLRAGSMTPWRDVRCTQGEAIEIKKAVKAYSGAHKRDLEEFLPVLATLRPSPLWLVGLALAGIDLLTIAAITWQLYAQLHAHHGPVGWGEMW